MKAGLLLVFCIIHISISCFFAYAKSDFPKKHSSQVDSRKLLNSDNWYNHPRIVKIRKEVAEIKKANLAKNVRKLCSIEPDTQGDGDGWTTRLATVSDFAMKGGSPAMRVIALYEFPNTGMEECRTEITSNIESYFNLQGKIIFSYKRTVFHGCALTERETRSYYDDNGHLILQVKDEGFGGHKEKDREVSTRETEYELWKTEVKKFEKQNGIERELKMLPCNSRESEKIEKLEKTENTRIGKLKSDPVLKKFIN